MIKVIDVYPQVKDEFLYVFSVSWNWNNFASGQNLWWMVRSGNMTLLEIALKGLALFIHHICLVTIQSDWITIQDDMCLKLAVPEERGLPICKWEEKGGGIYADEVSELRLCISCEDIVIRFMPQTQIVRFITTDRVRFGIDADDHLTAIQVTQLTPDEIEDVKRTFVR
jgi:hypothetical protein